jgi:hypothetical protein
MTAMRVIGASACGCMMATCCGNIACRRQHLSGQAWAFAGLQQGQSSLGALIAAAVSARSIVAAVASGSMITLAARRRTNRSR